MKEMKTLKCKYEKVLFKREKLYALILCKVQSTIIVFYEDKITDNNVYCLSTFRSK